MNSQENYAVFKEEIDQIINEAEQANVKDFTYNLILMIWDEFCTISDEEINENMIKDYTEEVKQSLEIMNPAFETDVQLVKILLATMEKYL
jgi:threonine dehydratase